MLGALLGACTEPVEASLELEAPAAARELAAGFEIAPDREPEPVAVFDAPSLVVLQPADQEGVDHCWFGVKAIGLPAVRGDGRVVAFLEDDPAGAADGYLTGSDFVTVDVVDIEGSDRKRLTDDFDDRGAPACRTYERRLRERVREYNVELQGYRPLEQLDVVVYDPDRMGEVDPSAILPASAVAPAQRPVQALYHAGWFALRVPGLHVLSREPKLEWRVNDLFCDPEPHIKDVFGDRRSGVGVVALDHVGPSCMCDEDAITLHPIAVPPEVFDELAHRPSERYLQLVDAACAAAAC